MLTVDNMTKGLLLVLIAFVVLAALPKLVMLGIGLILGILVRLQYSHFFGNDGEGKC